MKVFELESLIAQRHGGGVTDFTLYKEKKHEGNRLRDPNATIADLEFSSDAADVERVIFYDFEPRIDDCPLLLRAPRDLKVEAAHKTEAEAESKRGLFRSSRHQSAPAAAPAAR